MPLANVHFFFLHPHQCEIVTSHVGWSLEEGRNFIFPLFSLFFLTTPHSTRTGSLQRHFPERINCRRRRLLIITCGCRLLLLACGRCLSLLMACGRCLAQQPAACALAFRCLNQGLEESVALEPTDSLSTSLPGPSDGHVGASLSGGSFSELSSSRLKSAHCKKTRATAELAAEAESLRSGNPSSDTSSPKPSTS